MASLPVGGEKCSELRSERLFYNGDGCGRSKPGLLESGRSG